MDVHLSRTRPNTATPALFIGYSAVGSPITMLKIMGVAVHWITPQDVMKSGSCFSGVGKRRDVESRLPFQASDVS